MKLSLRHLTYFDALCQTGHFGHAADLVHVTQPALSVKIREMEDILGAPLIDRNERPFCPTVLGREVHEKARTILDQLSELEQTARRRRGLEGTFRLGAIPTVAPYLLPITLRMLQSRLPQLQLHLREATTQILLEELESGKLDACILASPVESPHLHQQILFEDRFVLAIERKQARALGLRDGAIQLTDMQPLKLLLLSEGHCLREQTQNLCRFASQEVLSQIGASSLHTLVGLASSGYGATLLPEIAIDQLVDGTNLALLRLARPEPDRSISLVSKHALADAMELGPLAQLLAEAGAKRIAATRGIIYC